jgi:uncharacterized membrane protein YfcA
LLDINPAIVLAGLLIGFLVGLTGIGGGALTTPLLILVFKVPPFVAVSSDLVAALAMKVVGGGVHLRRGTVQKPIVAWLSVGSVPGAFAGVIVLQWLDEGQVEAVITRALGAALLVAATMMVLRPALERRRQRSAPVPAPAATTGALAPRRAATVAVGALVGLAVGITSVGSGSLVVVSLLFLYPRLRSAELVGTDLVQAALLVASAAVGHLLFGQVQLGLTTSLVLGSVPGAYLGARASIKAPDRVLRPILCTVLALTGLRLI